jgi:hypothetical protein
MADLAAAMKEKQTEEHDVVDEAYRDGTDVSRWRATLVLGIGSLTGCMTQGYTVFSMPVGVLYRPSEGKLKNIDKRDYLGKAKLVAAAEQKDVDVSDPTKAPPVLFRSHTADAHFGDGNIESTPPLLRRRPTEASLSRSVSTGSAGSATKRTQSSFQLGRALSFSSWRNVGRKVIPAPSSAAATEESDSQRTFASASTDRIHETWDERDKDPQGRATRSHVIETDGQDDDPHGRLPSRPRDTSSPMLPWTERPGDPVDSTPGSIPSMPERVNKQGPLLVPQGYNKTSHVLYSPGRSPRTGVAADVKMVRRAKTVASGGQRKHTYEDEEGYGSAENEEVKRSLPIESTSLYRIRVKLHYQNDVRGLVGPALLLALLLALPLFLLRIDHGCVCACHAEHLIGNDTWDLFRQSTNQVSKV